jgi:hypothetical protein
MIGGLIKNTTLTPNQENEFLYGGFTFAFDVNEQSPTNENSFE